MGEQYECISHTRVQLMWRGSENWMQQAGRTAYGLYLHYCQKAGLDIILSCRVHYLYKWPVSILTRTHQLPSLWERAVQNITLNYLNYIWIGVSRKCSFSPEHWFTMTFPLNYISCTFWNYSLFGQEVDSSFYDCYAIALHRFFEKIVDVHL